MEKKGSPLGREVAKGTEVAGVQRDPMDSINKLG
jgi:hypothetical protein